MDVGGLSNSYKTLKQCHFLNDGGLRWTIADRWRDCGDASRALLFVASHFQASMATENETIAQNAGYS